MHLPRLLVPSLAVLFVAGLIGCGGGAGGPSFDTDPDTDGSTNGNADGGNTGTTDARAPVGDYTTTFSGNDGTTTFTGTGTGTAAADGALTLNLLAANTSNSTARTVNAVVATTGAVTGTVTVGAASAATITAGTLAKQTNGTYLLTTTFTNAASATENNQYTLTAATVTYRGPVTGTDNQGATYSGTGTGSISAGNVLGLTYTSRRSIGGVEETHTLSTTLLSNGTFSGAIDTGQRDETTTGTWVTGVNSSNVPTLTLRFTYLNRRYSTPPTVTEKLVLVKQ